MALFFYLFWECNDSQGRIGNSKKWRLVPTRREQEKWDKATKAATGGSVCSILTLLYYTSIGAFVTLQSLIMLVKLS